MHDCGAEAADDDAAREVGERRCVGHGRTRGVSGGEGGELEDKIQDWLSSEETENELEYGLERIYDLADNDGVWLDPAE